MLLRLAVEADLPTIVAIYNQAMLGRIATADTEPVPVESRIDWFRKHSPSRRPIWVVEDDGIVVGWLSLQDFYARPAYHATAEFSVYVATERQQQGIGRLLLREAIWQSPGLGINHLIGLIFAHNKVSLRLAEGFGFQRWGYLPGVTDFDGLERDVVIVGLRVPPGVSGS